MCTPGPKCLCQIINPAILCVAIDKIGTKEYQIHSLLLDEKSRIFKEILRTNTGK